MKIENNQAYISQLASQDRTSRVIDKLKPNKETSVNKSSISLDEDGNEIDEELMEACKTFETYLVEQTIKEMKKTIPKDGNESDTSSYFKEMLYNDYAKSITEQGEIGLAKELYISMKRNKDINS